MSSLDQTRQRAIDSELMTAETADSQIARWRDETGASEDAPGEPWIDWLADPDSAEE